MTLVYYAPCCSVTKKQTGTLPLEWDAQSTVSASCFPICHAPSLSRLAQEQKRSLMASLHSASHSPSRKFGSSGDVESDDDEDDEQTRKYSKPAPKVYPSIIRHIITRITKVILIDLLISQNSSFVPKGCAVLIQAPCSRLGDWIEPSW